MSVYLRSVVWDFVLCVVASTSLAYTICSGFYATQPYQDASGLFIMMGVSAALTAALFVATFNMRTKVIGLPIVVIAMGVSLVVAVSLGDAAGLDDVEGNRLLLLLCVMGPTVAVFALSRWRVTAVMLIVVGILCCGVIEYLYWYGHVVAFLVFLVSSAALYVYRTYQRSLLNSESDRLAFGSTTVAGVVIVAFAAAVALGVFAVVIAPLEPPSLTLKLITEHYRVDELEVRGTGAVNDAIDETLVSNITSTIVAMSDNVNEELENKQNNDAVGQGSNEDESSGLEDGGTEDTPTGTGLASLSLLFANWMVIAVVAGVILLIVAAIVAKKLLRRRRYRKMVAGGNDSGIVELYLFYMSRFKRFKIPEPGALTLAEYVVAFKDAFCKFEDVLADPMFSQLTDVYVRHVYGNGAVSDEDFSLFEDYYHLFYKRARRYMGWFKYCLLFFII